MATRHFWGQNTFSSIAPIILANAPAIAGLSFRHILGEQDADALYTKMTAAIQTHNLSKRYGDVLAVDGVNLRVDRGEIYAFLGLNGAGKTTTIRAMLGMIRPSTGGVSLFGEPIRHGGPRPVAKGRPSRGDAGGLSRADRARELGARRLHGVAQASATARVIERFGLSDYAGRPARAQRKSACKAMSWWR